MGSAGRQWVDGGGRPAKRLLGQPLQAAETLTRAEMTKSHGKPCLPLQHEVGS